MARATRRLPGAFGCARDEGVRSFRKGGKASALVDRVVAHRATSHWSTARRHCTGLTHIQMAAGVWAPERRGQRKGGSASRGLPEGESRSGALAESEANGSEGG